MLEDVFLKITTETTLNFLQSLKHNFYLFLQNFDSKQAVDYSFDHDIFIQYSRAVVLAFVNTITSVFVVFQAQYECNMPWERGVKKRLFIDGIVIDKRFLYSVASHKMLTSFLNSL